LADVLIVDDDADAAEALREVMTLEGHEVRVAYDGREGLAALATRIPDVVLLDVEMPVLDGPDMANEMLVHNLGLERLPIVLLSGVPIWRRSRRRSVRPTC
jgi:CheY-like chemotaxis protein